MFWSFVQIFYLCDFGESVSGRYASISENIYQSNWYLFPFDVQRLLPIIMISAQQPIILRGLGNVLYTREAFKNVISFFISSKIQLLNLD